MTTEWRSYIVIIRACLISIENTIIYRHRLNNNCLVLSPVVKPMNYTTLILCYYVILEVPTVALKQKSCRTNIVLSLGLVLPEMSRGLRKRHRSWDYEECTTTKRNYLLILSVFFFINFKLTDVLKCYLL